MTSCFRESCLIWWKARSLSPFSVG